MIGYLQHGQGYGPFRNSLRTERVNVMHEFGDRYQVWFEGRWRRVHIQVKRTYIVYRGAKITLQIEGTPV